MNFWLEALKVWNKKNKRYTIPKKGTKEHAEVVKLMDKMKNKAKKSKP